MKTLEGNKLIAEFMGWKFKTAAYNWEHSRIKNSTWTDLNKVGHYSLSFDSSWDWLMPVVEKINNIFASDTPNVWQGELNAKIDKVILLPLYTKINDAHTAVVKFIQWYNTKKQNP